MKEFTHHRDIALISFLYGLFVALVVNQVNQSLVSVYRKLLREMGLHCRHLKEWEIKICQQSDKEFANRVM
jgi:hypothetical protein